MNGETLKNFARNHGYGNNKLAACMGITSQNLSQQLAKDDIKIERETRELLDKYKGKDWLLCIRDRYKSARDYTQHINAGLKRLIPEDPFTRLSTYWARHSWATIAYNELGASVDTISAALGHRNGSRITAIYINPDTRKVDDLNRRLLDLLFAF